MGLAGYRGVSRRNLFLDQPRLAEVHRRSILERSTEDEQDDREEQDTDPDPRLLRASVPGEARVGRSDDDEERVDRGEEGRDAYPCGSQPDRSRPRRAVLA